MNVMTERKKKKRKEKNTEDIFMGGQFKKSEHEQGIRLGNYFIFFRGDNSILFQWLSSFNFKRREKSRGEILLGLPLNNGSLKNVHIHLYT